jgi:hypothetical protein
MKKIPARFGAFVTPLLLSLMMSFVVSFISTLRGIGWADNLVSTWMGAWGMSWLVAFPTMLLLLPMVRRLSSAIVEPS